MEDEARAEPGAPDYKALCQLKDAQLVRKQAIIVRRGQQIQRLQQQKTQLHQEMDRLRALLRELNGELEAQQAQQDQKHWQHLRNTSGGY